MNIGKEKIILELEGYKNEDDIYIGGSPIGYHHLCKGYIDTVQVSNEFIACTCRRCHLRLILKAKTYKDLKNEIFLWENEGK